MTERPNSDTCLHPNRGREERILGASSGDYFCAACQEPMPIIAEPARCMSCNEQVGRFIVEPVHQMAWQCLNCDNVWGWVPADYRPAPVQP